MDFVLNEYHRNVSEEELLNDLRRVAELLNSDSFSRSKYQKYGKFSYSTITRRFGSWNNAIKAIGLKVYEVSPRRHEFLEREEDFFSDLRLIAESLRKDYITVGEYEQYGKYYRGVLLQKYGSWDAILQMAGLKPTPFRLGKGKEISDEELFQDMERVWIKLGRQPTINDIKNGEFSFAQNTFTRRFGGWRGTLEAFVKYINSEDISNVPEEIIPNARPNGVVAIAAKPQSFKSSNSVIHRTRRDVNDRLRFKVMKRDNFKCCACGASPAKDPAVVLHVDHIIPWSKGGETEIDNLQTLCSKCNLGKSDLG